MQRCATCAEPQRTGTQRTFHQLTHLFNVVGSSGFISGAAIAHHVTAKWSVGNLSSKVDDVRA